jgi:hypothetical protein
MRNDARPIGEDSNLKSGAGPHGEKRQTEREQADGPESVERPDQSHVVNREADMKKSTVDS